MAKQFKAIKVEFANTATARLSTRTGLIYGTTQENTKSERYAMSFVDFKSGKTVEQVGLGRGKAYRIAMSPAYFLPPNKLIQPVRKGFVVMEPK